MLALFYFLDYISPPFDNMQYEMEQCIENAKKNVNVMKIIRGY